MTLQPSLSDCGLRLQILHQLTDITFLLDHGQIIYNFLDMTLLFFLLSCVHKLQIYLQSLKILLNMTQTVSLLDYVQEKTYKPPSSSQKLLVMAKNKPKRSGKYESLRSEVVQFFNKTFTSHLQSPTSQPLHEILFFHSKVVKRQLVGLPRPALTTALSNPHHYLLVSAANQASFSHCSINVAFIHSSHNHINYFSYIF